MVEPTNGSHIRLLLSCAHVFAPLGARFYKNPSFPGDQIFQPGPLDGDPISVGYLFASKALEDTGNRVDAALALLDPTVAASNVLATTPALRPRGILDANSPRLGQRIRVHKVGRSTGFTTGVVESWDFSDWVEVPNVFGSPRWVAFERQYVVTPDPAYASFSDEGDSGAMVLDEDQRAVGIVIAGGRGRSLVTPMNAVLSVSDHWDLRLLAA